jgi:hypothetical protein
MGNKRPSVRTLPSGERVTHYPPDPEHPKGKMVLLRENSSLRDTLNASATEDQAACNALWYAQQERIEAKQEAQKVAGLPPEKSVV